MNVRKLAYEIVLKTLKNSEFSDNLLSQKAKTTDLSSDQTAFLYNLVKGTIKYHAKLDYIIRQFTEAAKYDKTDLKIKTLLYLGLYQMLYMDSVPDHAAINETVDLTKESFGDGIAGFVNSILRSYQRNSRVDYPAETAERIATEHSYPVELIRQWIEIWGEEQSELLAISLNDPAKLHIRVNTLATSADRLKNYFAKRNINCTDSAASVNILITDNSHAALGDIAFEEGYYSIQDTSAALVVELLAPHAGESVLDLFSAPGGKCTYAAELMQDTGEIVAVDKTPHKMKLLKQAAQRLQLSCISMVTKDAFSYGPVAASFDKVLVDAPCSGWGVFGKKADLRWQLHQDLAALIKLQEKALNYAANFVKPGGIMVYSTCTMNPAENEQQVLKFLNKNKHFSLVKADALINPYYTENGFLKTMPLKHEMDGAFGARLLRCL